MQSIVCACHNIECDVRHTTCSPVACDVASELGFRFMKKSNRKAATARSRRLRHLVQAVGLALAWLPPVSMAEDLRLEDIEQFGFRIIGPAADDRVGYSVSGAGDVNGDGLADLIVGAPHVGAPDDAPPGQGISYVVFGQAAEHPLEVDLRILGPAQGFRIVGATDDDTSGISVSGAGDVNGDGFGDLIVGAYKAGRDESTPGAGTSYVIFGSGDGRPVDLRKV